MRETESPPRRTRQCAEVPTSVRARPTGQPLHLAVTLLHFDPDAPGIRAVGRGVLKGVGTAAAGRPLLRRAEQFHTRRPHAQRLPRLDPAGKDARPEAGQPGVPAQVDREQSPAEDLEIRLPPAHRRVVQGKAPREP